MQKSKVKPLNHAQKRSRQTAYGHNTNLNIESTRRRHVNLDLAKARSYFNREIKQALNVADVKNHYDGFEEDTVAIAESVGFKLVDTFDYVLSSQQSDSKSEPIYIFKK